MEKLTIYKVGLKSFATERAAAEYERQTKIRHMVSRLRLAMDGVEGNVINNIDLCAERLADHAPEIVDILQAYIKSNPSAD